MSNATDLSFLPDDYIAKCSRNRANRLCGSLLLVTILSVAGTFAFAQDKLDSLRQEYANVNAEYQKEADRLKRLDSLQKQQSELARRAKLAEALIEKTPRTEVLDSLKSRLPAGMSLSEVVLSSRIKVVAKTPEQVLAEKQARGSKKSAPAAPEVAPKLYDTTLKVVGMAHTDMQVADYINSLGSSRYFEEVNLLVTRDVTFQDQPVRRFEVEMIVRSVPKTAQGVDSSLATSQDQAAQ